jgi:competence protein ComEA
MDAAPTPTASGGANVPPSGNGLTAWSVTVHPPAAPATPDPVVAPAAPEQPPPRFPLPSFVQAAWPRPAQWATVGLLVLATGLLIFHGLRSLRWGSRPTDLERGLGYRVDLNRAGRAELLQLPAVGENLARRIIDYRQTNGGFRSVDDLANVHGVGPATLERLRPWVWVDTEEEPEERDRPMPPKRGKAAAPAQKVQRPKTVGRKEAALKGKPKININTAGAEELQKLPRVGKKLAGRIIEERQRARFRSPDDLKRVSGIGPKTLEGLRPYITVGDDGPRLARAE